MLSLVRALPGDAYSWQTMKRLAVHGFTAARVEGVMSEKIYDVLRSGPAGLGRSAKYQKMYARSSAIPTDSGPNRPSASAGSTVHQVENVSFAPGHISIKWFEDGILTSPGIASTGISTSAATRPRSSGRATIPRSRSTSPIVSCTTRSAIRQHPAHPQRPEG